MIVGSCFCALSTEASISNKINWNRPTKQNFVKLLNKAKDFHEAIKNSDAPQNLQKEADATKKIIAKLYTQIPSMPHMHQKLHAYKLLQSLEENISVLAIQNKTAGLSNKPRSNRVIKKMFKSFFELAEVYNLKNEVKDEIFYCSLDKSIWFQKKGKAINPVSFRFKQCGKKLL